jgi:putative ABC transport system substrate-binding protein
LAAQKATATIPIVGGLGGDPVAAGLITSLAKPGRNITGVTSISAALGRKRLELLKEITPNTSPVAVLWSPGAIQSGNRIQMRDIESAAHQLSLSLQEVPVHAAGEFESAFASQKKTRAHSLIVLASPFFASEMDQIVRLATRSRLPAIYPGRDWVEAGGLMSFGPDYPELMRRAAYYVDRILKGAKPADLPVETPTNFELVINLKTAKQIGLTIPSSVLNRADRVIRDK